MLETSLSDRHDAKVRESSGECGSGRERAGAGGSGLVAVMLRLEGAVLRDTQVVSLLFGQFGELHS